MKIIMRGLILAAFLVTFFLAGFLTDHRVAAAEPHKPLTQMRIYTGPDGESHTEQAEVKFSLVAGTPVEESDHIKAASTYLVRLAPGSYESWHNADKRRYALPLSGRAEIEVAGGHKVIIEPGQLVLAEDLTGKGHTFRVIGNEDWVALFVNFEQ
jgi:quercetin dioxygenase-like cupin family protein